MRKPAITFFAQNWVGGVQSLYNELLEEFKNDHHFHKRIILYHKIEENGSFNEKLEDCKKIIFNYSLNEEEYIYRNRLANIIEKKNGVIVTNFSLELKSITRSLFQNNTIFHITHDEQFIPIAVEFQNRIDVFISHNMYFVELLREKLPHRLNDIYFLPYGIKLKAGNKKINTTRSLRLLYLARLEKSKGLYDLLKIDDILKEKGLTLNWMVLGKGSEKEGFLDIVKERKNFTCYSPETKEEIYQLIPQNDLFILPSRLDGLPVALLETMSFGLVPVLSEFNPGIAKVVADGGYVLPVGDIASFAERIILLNENREELLLRSDRAKRLIYDKYNAENNFKEWFKLFNHYKELKKAELRTIENLNRIPSGERKGLYKRFIYFIFKS